ncbi:MAG: hypothetical protein IPK29_18375 [Betaproteobacteria bacterium]|nr:hypothetical protein [Betaproteobacteria bacterium]
MNGRKKRPGRRRPEILEARVGLRQDDQAAAAFGPCGGEGLFHPCDVGGLAFGMFGLIGRRGSGIVVAADDVQGHEGHPVHAPALVLAEPGVLRVGGLLHHRQRALTQAAACGEEQRAHTLEQRERVDLACGERRAVGPVVVAGCEDERVAHALERGQHGLVVFLYTWHGGLRGVAVVGARVELEVADMRDEGEIVRVQRREHALVLALLRARVGHVADQCEVESAFPAPGRAGGCAAGQQQGQQGGSDDLSCVGEQHVCLLDAPSVGRRASQDSKPRFASALKHPDTNVRGRM